ncbi:hypothetical protein B4U80_06376 [Leptotrombidium deliense]|uniref:Uncharacterized protein n=1 Tax=Leptotrombidium deliense TaxID=299467 RepID=A0A443SMC1_9ACAR|nr:hypothetical protein B4U80_06376 [Leptotrombidium deliense]
MLKTVCFLLFAIAAVKCQQQPPEAPQPVPQAPPQPPPQPRINWGQCPQLEPKESDKQAKAKVIQGCLQKIPVPTNITQETIVQHQREVALCALTTEQWFNEQGKYRYEKAENEIKRKGLQPVIQTRIVFHHNKCQTEAKEKQDVIQEVQMYQACMDYYIAQICGITVTTQ